MRTFAWYRWRRTSYNPSGEDIHGLTRDLPTPHPLPAVLGYNAVASMLRHVRSGQRLADKDKDVYIYEYHAGEDEIVWAAWTTRSEPVEVKLDISAAAGPVTVRPLLGPAEVKQFDDESTPLTLSLEPIFLRAKEKQK